MQHSAVFIGERKGILGEELAQASAALLPSAGTMRWLAEAEACEIDCQPASLDHARELEASLRSRLDGTAIDIALVPSGNRRKRLLIADMDSTIIEEECLDEMAELAGVRDKVARITLAGMRGDIPLQESVDQRMALLEGLEQQALAQIAARLTLRPGAAQLVATMRANGAHTALVSGGFTLFTGPVAAACGFDTHQGNVAAFQEGRLLRDLAEPFRGAAAKRDALLGLCRMHGISPADALCVGDGANDVEMVEAAGMGIAFHAKPVLREAADIRIDICDLTALLYCQGYRRDEFFFE